MVVLLSAPPVCCCLLIYNDFSRLFTLVRLLDPRPLALSGLLSPLAPPGTSREEFTCTPDALGSGVFFIYSISHTILGCFP